MGKMFKEAKTHLKSTIKEMNFPEIKQQLADQTKDAAIGFKKFGQDITNDIKVKLFYLKINFN